MTFEVDSNIKPYVIYGALHNVNVRALEQYVLDSVDILAFWNHIPLIYIVKTRLTAEQLAERFSSFFDGNYFIVTEIRPDNLSGWLPKPAWDWFRTPAPPTKNSRQQPSGLLSLFAPPKT